MLQKQTVMLSIYVEGKRIVNKPVGLQLFFPCPEKDQLVSAKIQSWLPRMQNSIMNVNLVKNNVDFGWMQVENIDEILII